MNRFWSTFRLNVQLQFRNGFYLVGALVAIISIVVLNYFFNQELLVWALPAIILCGITGTTFMFIAAMVLFEKTEGSQNALIVSPLRYGEYMYARLLSLTLLATLETIVTVTCTYGVQLNWVFLTIGMGFLYVFFALVGFIMVVRYQSVTEFLIPGTAVAVFFQLPVFTIFGVFDTGWIYLFPTYSMLLVVESAFMEVGEWAVSFSILYSITVLVIFYVYAKHCFERYIILQGDAL